MENFINHLNNALPDQNGDSILYKFKKKTLDEMTNRANEITSRGVNNRKVVEDLVISEHPNLEEEYKDYHNKQTAKANAKRNIILNVIGSALYLLLVIVIFLGVSFATKAWNMTWAIVVDGVLLWVVYLLSLGVKKFTSMKRIFHIFARIFLAGAIIVGTVAVYLGVLALTDDTTPNRWLIVIFGLMAMFLCDGVYAVAAKHRLAILTWQLYIPVISVFVFVAIGALAIMPWNIAWIVIPLSLILDLAIILIAIGKNKLEKLEVADTWNEN